MNEGTSKQKKPFPRWAKIAIAVVAAVLILPSVILSTVLGPHPAKPDASARRVACIGNSITFGAGVIFTHDTDAWPAVLDGLLGDGWQVINYGFSGRTLQDEGDSPYAESGFTDQAIETQAEVYIVMLGTNDSKPYNWDAERYERELDAYVTLLEQGDWDHEIVLMLPPKAFPEGEGKPVVYDISDETIHDCAIPAMLRVAEAHGLRTVDLYSYTQDHPEWFGDGVHPNVEGNQEIAQYVYEQLWG